MLVLVVVAACFETDVYASYQHMLRLEDVFVSTGRNWFKVRSNGIYMVDECLTVEGIIMANSVWCPIKSNPAYRKGVYRRFYRHLVADDSGR